MAWPNTNITTDNLDAGADNPSQARPDLLAAVTAINAIINQENTAEVPSDAAAGSGITTAVELAVVGRFAFIQGEISVASAATLVSGTAIFTTTDARLSVSSAKRFYVSLTQQGQFDQTGYLSMSNAATQVWTYYGPTIYGPDTLLLMNGITYLGTAGSTALQSA